MDIIQVAPGVTVSVQPIQRGDQMYLHLTAETPYGPYQVTIQSSVETLKQTLLAFRREYASKLYDFVTAPTAVKILQPSNVMTGAPSGWLAGGMHVHPHHVGLR